MIAFEVKPNGTYLWPSVGHQRRKVRERHFLRQAFESIWNFCRHKYLLK
jgi:hypothetical protein